MSRQVRATCIRSMTYAIVALQTPSKESVLCADSYKPNDLGSAFFGCLDIEYFCRLGLGLFHALIDATVVQSSRSVVATEASDCATFHILTSPATPPKAHSNRRTTQRPENPSSSPVSSLSWSSLSWFAPGSQSTGSGTPEESIWLMRGCRPRTSRALCTAMEMAKPYSDRTTRKKTASAAVAHLVHSGHRQQPLALAGPADLAGGDRSSAGRRPAGPRPPALTPYRRDVARTVCGGLAGSA